VQLHCRVSGEEREREREREREKMRLFRGEPGGQPPPFVNAEVVSRIQEEKERRTQRAGAEGENVPIGFPTNTDDSRRDGDLKTSPRRWYAPACETHGRASEQATVELDATREASERKRREERKLRERTEERRRRTRNGRETEEERERERGGGRKRERERERAGSKKA